MHNSLSCLLAALNLPLSQVTCAGQRQYTKADGECALDTDTVLHYVPKGQDNAFLGKLQPNFRYSCAVSTETDTGDLAASIHYLFSTNYQG